MIAEGDQVVVVGAGQAGFQLAASLREGGFPGRIVLVGEEPEPPYQRPPLSKAYLAGKTGAANLRLRGPDFYDAQAIVLRTGTRAVGLDRGAARLHLSSGEALAYDHLVLATGARNRPLIVPGAEFDGVFQLRTLADAEAIRAQLARVQRVAIIGAGFVGLEMAALAAGLGREVTLIEAADRPMARAVSAPTSRFFDTLHGEAGVRLVYDAAVSQVTGDPSRATGVATGDGHRFEAELVLVGIGVTPDVALARDAGLRIEDGVAVDDTLATNDPAVSAIGDCASYPSPFASGRRVRLESVQNALDHGRCVAARLLSRPAPYASLPWFWSDQGAAKLQIAGLANPHDSAVVRGDPAAGAFSVFCFAGDELVGVESINKPGDHMAARRLLTAGVSITPAMAADPAVSLKDLAGAGPGRSSSIAGRI